MAELIVQAVTVYLVAGAVVAAAFLLFGLDRVDPRARGAYLFRPMIAPGLVLLWPLVVPRWRALARNRARGAATAASTAAPGPRWR